MEYIDTYMLEKESSRFKCEQCGRCYRHAGSLANHKKAHEVGSFQCPLCIRVLSNALALKNHLRIHTSKKSFSCSVCGKAFRLFSQLIVHHQVHGSQGSYEESIKKDHLESRTIMQENGERPDQNTLINTDMTDKFNDNSSTEEKKSVTNDSVDRPFKCDQCEKTYRHHGSLINHKKSHQLGVFQCSICYKQFNNLAALNNHQRTHTKSKFQTTPVHISTQPQEAVSDLCLTASQKSATAWFCNLCDISFPKKRNLKEHILMHSTSSSASELSDSCYYADSDTFLHSKKHFPPSHQLDKWEAGEHTNNQLYTCAYCGVKYSDLENLKDHYLTHNSPSTSSPQSDSQMPDSKQSGHGLQALEMASGKEAEVSNSLSEDTKDRRFTCHICGKRYRHAGSLINHKHSHQTGSYQCSVCCKYYPHLAALNRHLRSHRTTSPGLPFDIEGDWLSPEPLTLELQQSSCNNQDQEDNSSPLHDNVVGISHQVYYNSNIDGLNEIHEQDRLEHTLLPSVNQMEERHMCADCGETYRDITGIKSHLCPQRCQQQQYITSGILANDKEECPLQNCRDLKWNNKQGSLSLINSCSGDTKEDDGEAYQCSECGNHYTSLWALKSHLCGKTHFQGIPMSMDLSSTNEENWRMMEMEGSLIICSTCGESFFNEHDLQAHQPLHGQDGTDEVAQNKTDNTYSTDVKTEEKSHICGECGMFCTEYNELEAHECAVKGKGKKLNVEKQVDGPRYFQPNLDSGDHPHRCDQCGRTYRHLNSLLNHKKSHRTGVFRCHVCQKRFYNLLALKSHHRTHFDLKRHKCEKCGKAFKIQKQLLNHLQVHKEKKAKFQDLNQLHQSFQHGCRTEADEVLPKYSPSRVVSKKKTQSWCKQPNAICRKCGVKHRLKKPCHDPDSWIEQEAERLEGTEMRFQPFAYDHYGETRCHAGNLVYHKKAHKTAEYICTSTYSKQHTMKNHLHTHLADNKCSLQECGKGQKRLSCYKYSFNGKKMPQRVHMQPLEVRELKGGLGFKGSTDQLLTHCHTAKLSDNSDQKVTDDHGFVQKEDRPFVCNICNRTYRHAGSLVNHKNTHKTGIFCCSICSKDFFNALALRNHTRIHTQKKKHVCTTCGKAFRLASILLNHQKIHTQKNMHFSCPTCTKTFLVKSGLEQHHCGKNQKPYLKEVSRKTHAYPRKNDRDNRFKCEQCERTYRHASSLINHRNTHTTGIYHCALCPKTFYNLMALKNHRRIHSEVRRYSCQDCDKSFRVSSQLRSHQRVHMKQQELFCSTCQQSFRSHLSFRKHQELRCKAQQLPQQDMSGHSELDWNSGLDIAVMAAQGLDTNGLPRPSTVFPCMQSMLPVVENQQEGIKETSQKVHICEHCGRTYRHASSLLNHKNSHKLGIYICSTCKKEFSNLMALKNHRRIHTEPKRYVCSDCGKAFRVSTQLICHQRVHTKEKPFSCTHCGKNFSSKSNLRHHQKVHNKHFEACIDTGTKSILGIGIETYL
ncbi:zinc finger protein 646-like [Paramormyrops kingsleyae]|uniref:zinc finger protein 646-like n=1 Tax=Paramormyrops kingsleyae TaxID=1676925 RepID=UPI003B97BC74